VKSVSNQFLAVSRHAYITRADNHAVLTESEAITNKSKIECEEFFPFIVSKIIFLLFSS
jgi:hypothetical protein